VLKLVSLRTSGFKRLEIQEKLEFPDGRLLIHGRNESGKSTLLETIHYALYGMPLRPSKKAGNKDIICYGREKAIVELEFSIDEAHYQVRRELKKKKTNLHFLNKREANGNLNRVATGARNVNNEISKILHGIDSDALLNSCLVEQKELGKLEDANKQERIKAMSSLLNLEAFNDARNKLKKECSEFEKVHLQTLNKLKESEVAKRECEKAENIKNEAEKRLKEIIEEKKQVAEILTKLQKDLKIIQQMKYHQSKIMENQTKLEGKKDELILLTGTLQELKKTEKELEDIEDNLPEAKKKLLELEEKLEKVQRLSQLEDEIKEISSKLEKNSIILTENKRAYNEAFNAKNRVEELEEEIKLYTPVLSAASLIDEISNLFLIQFNSKIESSRIEQQIESIKARLEQTKDTVEKIKHLETAEQQLSSAKNNSQKMKTGGIVSISVGLLLLAFNATGFNTYISLLGTLILVIGGYLLVFNKSNLMDEKLSEIREERESMLGERARIRDYYTTIETLTEELDDTKKKWVIIQEKLIRILNQLPEKPMEYISTISLTDLDSVNTLRNHIQEDSKTLIRYTTESSNLKQKANSIETVNKTELEKLEKQIEIEQLETGINADEEDIIRKQYAEVSNKLTELKTNKTQYLRNLEKRPRVQNDISNIRNETNLLLATLQQHKSKIKELEKKGVNLGDETTLSEERDSNNRKSAQLAQEEKERESDIAESNKIIEKTSKLKEEYPILVEETKSMEFRLEAIRRAAILLDTTRDSIMSGVKQNVEKNMMQFLPTLTDNRYNMARIDETNYRIEVYDRSAKQWRGKGVFSGATQDQFSLALRLAFAISTIPSSRGARPGFIFLDEPLSGFDTQRRIGFMQLLREDLSRHFDQIIVISHIEALVDEFENSLTLESGKIIELQR
jgi:exonuclease SbcC